MHFDDGKSCIVSERDGSSIHNDSKLLAPSDIHNESQEELERHLSYESIKADVEHYKSTHPAFIVDGQFYRDLQDFYSTLRVIETGNDALPLLALCQDTVDGVSVSCSASVKDGRAYLPSTGIQAVHTIRVQGPATYARFTMYGITESIPLTRGPGGFYFAGPDLKRPLFNAVAGGFYVIETDGLAVEFGAIYLRSKVNNFLYTFGNNSAVTILPSGEAILCGHMWNPSYILQPPALALAHALAEA